MKNLLSILALAAFAVLCVQCAARRSHSVHGEIDKEADTDIFDILPEFPKDRPPLFVLDGMTVFPEQIANLKKDQIKSVSVLKDDIAKSVFGPHTANGVIVINSYRSSEDRAQHNSIVKDITVTGKVTDCEGKPLSGASILEDGKISNGTSADLSGNYKLTVQNTSAVLGFSYVGFKTQRIKVGSKTIIDVSLTESDDTIKNVIIKGKESYTRKPVIYLYPERVTDVSVKVDFDGEMQFTYPDYGSGWHVTASPDGSLVNKADGMQYSYLFWDGASYPARTVYETGYVIHIDNVTGFLQEILPQYGLLPHEYNEFIVYWAPLMKQNEWNFIHFRSGADYDAISKNTVVPHPQTEIRVFMDFAGVDGPFEVKPQIPTAPARRGFTLVEWGGRELMQAIRVKTADGEFREIEN